jgi:hypothetical protein
LGVVWGHWESFGVIGSRLGKIGLFL